MTPKQLFALLSQGKLPPQIPFAPTVYEHGAKLIGKTPSEVAQSEELLVQCQLESYELYRQDLVSVGLDIYNVELEALGAPMTYYDDNTLPSAENGILSELSMADGLTIPDPERDGRMPLFLNACERIQREIGGEVGVSGTVMGPFTLAASLRGFENFILDLLEEPEKAGALLEFAAKVALRFSECYLKRGVSIVLNESWISPPLLSPGLYREFVLPVQTKLIAAIRALGSPSVALICGGNTIPIAEDMVKTGTSLLIADFNADYGVYRNLCERENITLRVNLEPQLIETGDEEKILKNARTLMENCGDYPRFVMGCGVVSYDTEPETIIRLRDFVKSFDRNR